jgi:hypothetical protein
VLVLVVGGGVVAWAVSTRDDRSPDVATTPATTPETTTSSVPAPTVPVPPAPATSASTTTTIAVGLDRAGLSTAGIGVLRFGATSEEAEAITGSRAAPSATCGEGLAVMSVDGVGLVFVDDRFAVWSVKEPGWSTLSGLTVGMSAADAIARVPALQRLDEGGSSYLVLPPVPTDLLIVLGPDDRVEAVTASGSGGLVPGSDLC